MTSSSGSEVEVARYAKSETRAVKSRRRAAGFAEIAMFLGGEKSFGFISLLLRKETASIIGEIFFKKYNLIF